MTRHPAAGLSKRQREAFDRIAAGDDVGIHPATGAALAKRGLVTLIRSRWRTDPRALRYGVPIGHHIQWAAWCAEQPDLKP